MEASEEEKEFEEIFAKIKHLKVESVKRKTIQSRCKNKARNHLQLSKNESLVDKALHKTRTIGPKYLLKESKLKIPIKMLPELSKSGTSNRTSITNKEPEITKQDSDQNRKEKTIHRSCSMEFRNAAACNQDDLFDTESSDLADYLEQVLYLPKPMSAMAEMMYG